MKDEMRTDRHTIDCSSFRLHPSSFLHYHVAAIGTGPAAPFGAAVTYWSTSVLSVRAVASPHTRQRTRTAPDSTVAPSSTTESCTRALAATFALPSTSENDGDQSSASGSVIIGMPALRRWYSRNAWR